MAYSNQEKVLETNRSAATTVNLAAIDVRGLWCGSIAIDWTGASASDATVKLQESLDSVIWRDITSKSVTITSGAGNGRMELLQVTYPWMRLVVTHGSETTGTFNARNYFIGAR